MDLHRQINFTQEQEDRIVSLLRERLTIEEVSHEMGCGRKPIIRIARKYDVKLPRARFALTPAQEREVIALIIQHVSMPEIAKRYGCNTKSIARIAKVFGLKPDANRFQATSEQTKTIIERYLNGEPIRQLARWMHASTPNIKRLLIENGVSLRPAYTPKEKEEAICLDYTKGGLTIAHITDKHQVTEKVVWRLIKQRGLIREIPAKPRPRNDRGSFYNRWLIRYGKEEADRRREAHISRCSKHSRGSGNAMYGKPAPQGSGNGWKGWYKGRFFRSLRELAFMLELEECGVQWINGERKEYRVSYICPTGTERTYAPDFIVPNEAMIEIKPKKLWNSPLVLAKQKAAEKLCEQLGLKYRLVDPVLDEAKLLAVHKAGDIKWIGNTEQRFLAYYEVKLNPSSSPRLCAGEWR